jgi:hypothetical protein
MFAYVRAVESAAESRGGERIAEEEGVVERRALRFVRTSCSTSMKG